MKALQKPRGYWTLKTCKQDAAKYKSRSQWEQNSGSGYNKALVMGWLEECCGHMERLGNLHNRKLYAFEHPDKSVYVGLTFNYVDRYNQHMRKNTILIAKAKLGGQRFITLNELYPRDVAVVKEAELIEDYRSRGWTILNKIKAGGLGGRTQRWFLPDCKKDALRFKSKKEWSIKSAGAWDAARTNGWIDKCCGHMVVSKLRNGTWTFDACVKEAKKFKRRGLWKEKSAASYGVAWNNGWLEECCNHMAQIRVPKGTRTLETCKADAKKYSSRVEWQKKSLPMYKVASRNNWIDECCRHMIPSRNPEGFWNNLSRCQEEALKYKSRSEWQKKSHSSYKAAARNGWLAECSGHMKLLRKAS